MKIISEPSATRYTAFKAIKSNIKIAITPPRITQMRSNLVQSFITSHAIPANVQGQRSKVKVTA